MSELSQWDSFYLIVGGAAGALIGLQFVVMTLISARPIAPVKEAGAAFATPTIVHFGSAFLLSAIIRAPWRDLAPLAIVLGLVGLIGIVYSCIVARRVRDQNSYETVFEDWLFHALLPLAGYTIIAISAIAVVSYAREALFGIGASTLLLLIIGIHNSWDAVTYNVFLNAETGESPQPIDKGDGSDVTEEGLEE
jgi:tetrahydromethanopterin S-methyltransferase subunit E